ncbi:phosphotransferase [Paenibacillus humicola]|uniref:phosphotransferase n=1 Tax=Paenibacillus humicola TaxID=3110540 RepID=UPI00237C23BE|nr:phosphotransferase [Paenibacillus humicola]
MKVKYAIRDNVLIDGLNRHYGLHIRELSFIPHGDSAYSYLASDGEGRRCYMKLFDLANARQKAGAERLDLYMPFIWNVYERGIFTRLSCPIRTAEGRFKAELSRGLTVALFQFIDGETLAGAYPFPEAVMRRIADSTAMIHQSFAPLPKADAPYERETFDLSFAPDLTGYLRELDRNGTGGDPYRTRLRELVLPQQAEIAGLLELLQDIRSNASFTESEKVFCHGDIWGGNLISAPDGELYFIDWEAMIYAPRERDLFPFLGETFTAFIASYRKRLGRPVSLQAGLLRFYIYRHHLSNLTNWIANILHRNTNAEQTVNDLEMIEHHCLDRWQSAESDIGRVQQQQE